MKYISGGINGGSVTGVCGGARILLYDIPTYVYITFCSGAPLLARIEEAVADAGGEMA